MTKVDQMDLQEFIKVHEKTRTSEIKLADQFVETLTSDDLHRLAVTYVADEIRRARRRRQLMVEEEAAKRGADQRRQREERQQREEQQRRAERYQEQMKAEGIERKEILERRGLEWITNPASSFNDREARKFSSHGEEFAEWFYDHKSPETPSFHDWLILVEKMIPDEYERKISDTFYLYSLIDIRCNRRITDSLATLERSIVEQTEIRVTRELLETIFSVGDGTRVTWGEATVDQHQTRIDHLRTNVRANAEALARHQVAINMIENANARTLYDLGEH